MNLKDIDLLLALYSEKSITKTAEKTFISQPALTKRIKKLEEEFQTTLILRTSRGVSFTSDGEKLVQHFKKITENLLAMNHDMLASVNEIQGELQLGVASVFAHFQLPELLSAYHSRYPKVSLAIKSGKTSDIYKLLQKNEVTAAILREGYAWEDQKLLLNTDPLCLAYHQPISLPELPQHSYIHYDTDPHLNYQIEHWWNERFASRPQISVATGNTATAVEMLKKGLGWAIVSAMSLKDFDGYSVPLFWLDGRPFERSTWLCYRQQQLQLAPLASFISFMQNRTDSQQALH